MSARHQSGPGLDLAAGPQHLSLDGTRRLRARRAGWLAVRRGQVWLTRHGDAGDHVLSSGERLWLHRGEDVVVEPFHAGQRAGLGWQQAPAAQWSAGRRLRRLGAWPGAGAGVVFAVAARALRGLALALLAAARHAESMASRTQGRIEAGDSIASCGALQ